MAFDEESWQRIIFEALRPVDPEALFRISLVELDFRDLGGGLPEDFPGDELADFVDRWLAGLDPDAGDFFTDWNAGGVRLRIQAHGRSLAWRGARDFPSFNMLEPQLADLHLTSGERRRLIDLSLAEIDELATGKKTLIGQGASYRDTFEGMAHEMRHFKLKAVAELHPTVLLTYASMLGLGAGTPTMGNYDATWRAMHRIPPDD